jgi:hypothetical protein
VIPLPLELEHSGGSKLEPLGRGSPRLRFHESAKPGGLAPSRASFAPRAHDQLTKAPCLTFSAILLMELQFARSVKRSKWRQR